MVGSNRTIHSHASAGLMALWKSQTGTGLALLGAAGAVTPIHQDPTWKTGMTVRTALVLWYEDEGRVFSVASPTVGLGMEVRSMPGAAGHSRENEVIFQLAIDPVAAAIYIPFLIGSAIYGLPH